MSSRFIHMYVKQSHRLLEVCLYLPFFQREVACFWDASWFELVYSFWDSSGLNKKLKEGKSLLLLNSLTLILCYSEHSLDDHCTNKTTKVEIGAHDGYFSLKKTFLSRYAKRDIFSWPRICWKNKVISKFGLFLPKTFLGKF